MAAEPIDLERSFRQRAAAPRVWVCTGPLAALSLTLVALVVLMAATPAAAHGGAGSDATNYRARVLDPGRVGRERKVYGGDALIQLTNRTGQTVTASATRVSRTSASA